MIKQDIPLYKLDLTATSEFNHVKNQYASRKDVAQNQIVIPPGGPFYQKSFKMTDMSGKPLVLNEDYEFYGIMNKLTAYTAKPVGLFVRILKEEIREWKWDYQVVGNFNKLTNEILNMLHSIYEDDRYVLWENIENKPLWFDPELHQHDLTYEIFGFTDLARELNRVAHIQGSQKAAAVLFLENFRDHIEFYCNSFRALLKGIIDNHSSHKYDQHGVRKEHIGLDKVDNFSTATLEETLEGLRDDLFITPYNAALAVTATAGRNDKLYPSGKLPLLRYGSDTFIPPTISGAFEGLGGTTSRCGALVESDGTLLVLRHRNNGKVRGLYFTRCSDWRSKNPTYEFTAYTYQHPTATAAGAVLDTIIDGSNRYIMVVGDSMKGLYWWCETHNTFNPDRHILIPFNGPWVSEDMDPKRYNPANIYNYLGLASVCADENYNDAWCIVQGYPLNDLKDKRPNAIPDWGSMGTASWGSGAIILGGFTINLVSGNTINRVNVDYSHPVFGKFNDKIWSPNWPEVVIENGERKIKSFFAKYQPAVKTVQLYNSPRVYWKKFSQGNEFAIRIDFRGREFTYGGDGGWGRVLSTKAKVSFGIVNGQNTAKITPADGQDKLWTINPEVRTAGTLEIDQYTANNVTSLQLSAQDQTGVVQISSEVGFSLSGTGNVAFPPSYTVHESSFLKSAEAMMSPDNASSGNTYLYHWKRFNEQNPIRMGSMFSAQRCIMTDIENYASSGMMVKQLKVSDDRLNGYSEWFFRPAAYMNSSYEHIAPAFLSSFNGANYKHYPFVSKGAVVKGLGFQVPMVSQAPIPGAGLAAINKNAQRYNLGASCTSRLMGLMDFNESVSGPFTDFKLVWENKVTMDGVSPTFSPVVVADLRAAITRDVVPMFTAVGYTAKEVMDTWIMGRVLSPTGATHLVIKMFKVLPGTFMIESCCVIATIALKGSPTTVNGYSHYSDVTITKLSEPNKFAQEGPAVNGGLTYPRYDRDVANTPGFVATIPFKSRNGTTYDRTTYTVVIMPDTRWVGAGGGSVSPSLLEVSADGRTILNHSRTSMPEWGTDTGGIFMPYYGWGFGGAGANTFEGAAVAGTVPDLTKGAYEAISRGMTETLPAIGMSNILIPQFTVYFNAIENTLLAGKMYDIPATYIDILDQDPSPANKTYYVYVYYASGLAEYIISPTIRPESSTQSLIATVICGPTQIDRIIPYNRFSMNGVVISAKRQGSSILASSGSIDGVGDTSTILLDSDFVS